MKMRKIGVVGYGYVGKAMAELFSGTCKVYFYDPEYIHDGSPYLSDSGDEGNQVGTIPCQSIQDINDMDCDLVAICVPTEMRDDMSCDTSIVAKVVREVDGGVIVIKSTVPPGTTEELIKETGKDIIFSPEFAGESKYWSPYAFDTDMKETPWYIFGGSKRNVRKALKLFTPILGPTKRYRITNSRTAELVKYWENTFFAMKVTFCNEMFEVCEAMEIDYNEARELWLEDPRVNRMHTSVFEDNRGYGGKCYPKDTNALVMASKEAGYNPELLLAMIKANKKFRNKNK